MTIAPFQGLINYYRLTLGVALGFHISPRWGLSLLVHLATHGGLGDDAAR